VLLKKGSRHLLGIAITFVSVTILIRESLGTGKTFSISQDAEFHLGPLFSIMSRQIDLNIWPNYAPQLIMGVPLFNNQQFSPYYPFYFLSGNFFQNPESASLSLNLIAVMHVYIFALGGYFLMTALKANTSFAILGGVFIAVNAQNEMVMGWVNIISPYAWVPTVVAFFIRFLRKPNQLDAFGFSIAFFFLVSASPAQPLIHVSYILLIIFLFKYFDIAWSERLRYIERIFFEGIIALLFLFALVIPVILPILATQEKMIRWIGKYGALQGSQKMSFDAFIYDQLEFKEIKSIFFEVQNIHTNGNPFLGVVVASLLIVAVFTAISHKNWELRAFTFISVYSLISIFGDNTFLGHLNYNLPLIDRIREPTRFLQVLNFTAPIAGLLSLQLLISKLSISKKKLTKPTVSLFLLFLFSLGSSFNSYPYSSSTVLQENWRELQPIYSIIKKLDPMRQFKVAYAGEISYQNASMYGSYEDMYSLNAYFNPAPEDRMRSVYGGGYLNNLDYSQSLGVKYIICKKCTTQLEIALEPYKTIAKIGTVSLLSSNGAYPYLYAQNGINEREKNSESVINQINDIHTVKPKIYLDDGNKQFPISTSHFTCSFVPGPVYLVRESTANCESKSLVLLNEFYSTDLIVTSNGKTVPTFRVNSDVTGFELEQGKHALKISVKPAIVWDSYMISVALIFICILLAFFRFTKARDQIRFRTR
jgi:hypothetical protein